MEQVVPVLRTGNKHAPRLASKVSHRRGLILVCKSHHRGRVVLEMASKRERNLLLCGFERLLDEMNRLDPTLDDAGALRKRLPRRQSVLGFFEPETRPPAITTSIETSEVPENEEGQSPIRRGSKTSASTLSSPPSRRESRTASASKRDSGPTEQLYVTRFDAPVPAPAAATLRRTSLIRAVPAQT